MRKLLLLLCFPLIGLAQNEDSLFIKKMSDDILKNGKAYDLLQHLTKKIGGRLAGSPQYNMAEAWGAKTLKELGADTVFLQECLVPNWKRGKGDFAYLITKNSKKQLSMAALGNSNGSQKPITAPLLYVESFEELEQRKNEVKGKIVYFNKGFDATNIRPFMSYGQTGVYRRNGASAAAKYGAIGVIIRSLSEATDNHAHTGMMVYNDSFPKIPAISIGIEDANFFSKNVAKNNAYQVTMLTHGIMYKDTINHSVIAEIKGSEFPNEYITIGGHLDSWDLAEGAHDDGTGIVQTMELLRVFKALHYQPKHTIRFVLFANEENGLKGGNKYAEVAKQKNEKHIFALESDAGGFTPRGFSITIEKAKFSKVQAWQKLLQPYGTEFISAGGGGADISPLNRTFNTPVAEFMPDPQRYFDVHHAASDVFEAVNKRELLLGAVNMAGLIYLVDKYGL